MPAATSFAGPNLALLLLGAYRRLVDAAVLELTELGYADVRPSENYAMRAIETGADNASELGRRMSVTKQAAAVIIESLLEHGYATRTADPSDARRKTITLTPSGVDYLRQGEAVFNKLRKQLERQIGRADLKTLEANLTAFIGDAPVRLDAPGWVAQAL